MERIIAARKGVKTRRQNQAELEFINKVVKPEKERFQSIITALLRKSGDGIRLHYKPLQQTPMRLKNGVEFGQLVGFAHGRFLKVIPDGYKTAHLYSPLSWEVAE
jgi:hypothetical protein